MDKPVVDDEPVMEKPVTDKGRAEATDGADGADGPDGPPRASGAYGLVTGAAYGALFVLGAVIGLIGSFAYPWLLGPVPIAAILLILLNFGFLLPCGLAMGGRLGAVVPAAGWVAIVTLMQGGRSEGDLVIAGTLEGYLFLIGGMVAAGAAIVRTPAARPPGEWMLGGGAR